MLSKLQRVRLALMAGLTLALVMASLATRSRVDHLTAQLARESEQTQALRSKVELLQGQVKQYSSAREVAPRAQEDLGLVLPEPDRVHVLHFATPHNRHALVSEAYAGKPAGSGK